MVFNDDFMRELHSRCDIEQVISPYVHLKRRGKNLVGLCPFHNEKTPSFTVYTDTQSFYCFGCGAAGEVISFVRRINNIDFAEAVRSLADSFGVAMPQEGYDDSMLKLRRRVYEINREAARFFHEMLMSEQGRAGLDYFISRGYSMQTIRHFGLGFAPNSWDSLIKYMRNKGYSQEELFQANLVNRSQKTERTSYYDNFRNRVIIPIIDVRGNVVAFGARVLDDSKPKYINTADTPVYKKSLGVFALNFAKNNPGRTIIVVEGYMDVIALHQAGFTNAIACLGTSLTNEMAQLVSRYADEVILCYDADEAGQKATRRALEIFGSIGSLKVRVLLMSGGKDPDEIIKKFGARRFQLLMDEAGNGIEYRLLQQRMRYDLNTTDGKLTFLKKAAQILASEGDDLGIDLYSSRLAEECGVSKDAIVTQVRAYQKQNRRMHEKKEFQSAMATANGPSEKINPEKVGNRLAAKAEEMLLASLMRNPDFYPKIAERLKVEDFVTGFNRRLYEVLSWRCQSQQEVSPELLISHFNPEEMDEVYRIFHMSQSLSNTIKECRDCIDVLRAEKKKKQSVPTNFSEISDEEYRALFDRMKGSTRHGE